MNFRLTAILLGLFLVFIVALLAITFLDDSPTVGGTVFEELSATGVKAKDIDAVEIERSEPVGKLLLVRTGKDRWEIKEPIVAKADAAAVDRVISALLSAKPVASPDTAMGPAALGLAPAALKVTLRKGSERAETLNVGKVALGGTTAPVFVASSAHPSRPMAVRRSDLDVLFRDDTRKEAGDAAAAYVKWANDYRSTRLFGPDPHSAEHQVAALTLSSKGKTLALANTKDGWKIEAPPLGAADPAGDPTPTPNVFTGVRPLLSAITGLQAISPADFISAPKDLKEYGLEPGNPDAVRIELKPKEGASEIVFVGQKVAGEPGKVYARVEGETGVVKAQASNVDGLAAAVANPATLRDRNLLEAEKDRIDALDLVVGGQTTKLRKLGTPPAWTLFGGPHDPQPAHAAVVDAMLNVLAEKRTVRDFPAANDAFFAPAEVKAEVKVWSDAIDPRADAKKEPDLKDKPATTLLFGKIEGDAIQVRRTRPDGTKTDLLLSQTVAIGPGKTPAKVIDAVAKTRYDFLELQLKSFAPTQANRLTYTRGAETVELHKTEALDAQYPTIGRWDFDKPADRKGWTANADRINTLLSDLGSLTAAKIVAEEAKPEQLAGWGLDPKAPKLKVTVGLTAADDKERTYEFGNEAEDKANVYAHVGGRSEVFLVSKYAVERFGPAAELRDNVVVNFDRNKVKGLKIRGWAELNKVVTTLELEKKDGQWIAKAPPGFSPDSTKVDKLVDALFVAKAKTFLGPNKDAYGFGVETQKGLEINVQLEGQPAVVLNIGAEVEGGKSYYMICSEHPNEVVTVDVELFKAFKEKPASLAK